MPLFPPPEHAAACGIGNLSMRPCTDADVVAELPVVQVVTTLLAGAREGGDFVLSIAVAGEHGLPERLHRPYFIFIGQDGRISMEAGVRFQGELVPRQVLWLQRECRLQIGSGSRGILVR